MSSDAPHPLPAKQGQPDLCGYQGLWHSFPGDRAGPGVMHKGVGVWGGSEKSPAGLGRAGELKGPWQLPKPLCLGKESTA